MQHIIYIVTVQQLGVSRHWELVVGLTLLRTALVEFVVDKVAVREVSFADTVVSHVSIFQLVLHTQLGCRKHRMIDSVERVTEQRLHGVALSLVGSLLHFLFVCLFVYFSYKHINI